MEENPTSSPKVALLDYYTTPEEVIVFVIKKDLQEPLVFRTRTRICEYTTFEHINLCLQRLLIDFNGLSSNWKKLLVSDLERKKVENSLELNPSVPIGMRVWDENYPGHLLTDSDYKFDLDYLHSLSDILFPRGLKENIKDCDILCIAPHGLLHSIPFHAVKWNEDKFAIENFGICYIPSASTLKYCQTKNLRRTSSSGYRPEKCIVVCSGQNSDYTKFEKDIDLLSQYKWKNIIKLKTLEAKKPNVIDKISNIDVIHFSCHGLFGADMNQDPLESGLLLTTDKGPIERLEDVKKSNPNERHLYFLTAREIFNVSLHANLVTLRACSSGRATVRSGDELIGLTRAFLYAGTPSLIVSLWNVHIESSRMLLSEFYKLWLDEVKPLQKWKAIQQAQISFIKSKEKKYSHPYHWAPFILIGDWI